MVRFILAVMMMFSTVAFSQEAKERTVRVHGVGKVQAVPDQMQVGIQINVPKAETAQLALSQNSQLARQVIAMLKHFGIADNDMQTTRVSINPVYDYSKQNRPPVIVGYSAQNEVVVTIKKMEDAGKILDQAVQNGATGIGQIQYESSKRTELERDALRRAADDARVKAELLAKQLGATLGQVMTISASGFNYPSPVRPMMMMKSESASADVPVMPGEMEISANVEVVFELK